MLVRFLVALALGALLGLERELVGKEAAGIRTLMLVTGGAAVFTTMALVLPYIVVVGSGDTVADIVGHNSGFLSMIANVVVGVGFLGAGLIIKTDAGEPHNVTTAALIWAAAAIGVVIGTGLYEFGVSAAVILTALLYLLRGLNLSERRKSL